MQVGSLVECINGKPNDISIISPEIIPKKGIIYTVRSVDQRKEGTFLRFEEIVNKPKQYKDEYGEKQFGVEGFREVQPPMYISAVFLDQLKVTNENSNH